MSNPQGRAATEALSRLRLLLDVSRILGGAVDDLAPSLTAVAEVCVPDFADLCAIELLSPEGVPEAVAFRTSSVSGLPLRSRWEPAGAHFSLPRAAVLGFGGPGDDGAIGRLRESLGADSVIVAPIAAGGVTLGWMFCANGAARRGFRPSALSVAEEISRQIGVAAQRVMLHRERIRTVEAQERTARQLRRLNAAAGNLAGARTAADVLQVACTEACLILDAEGATAVWEHDGPVVVGHAGVGHDDGALLDALQERRTVRRGDWLALPLPCAAPSHRAALAIRGADLSDAAESVLGSFAALVPLAFERALTTDASRRHERQLQAVFDTSPVALIAATPDGRVVAANPAAAALFGWDTAADEVAFPSCVAPLLRTVIAQTVATGAVDDIPVIAEAFDLSVSANVVQPGSGEASVIIAASDLSEQHGAQRAVLHAQRLEAMGQLAGGLAHDFNNLLTVIIGSAATLTKVRDPDGQAQLIGSIEGAASRAGDLTRQLLGFARRPVDEAATVDLGEAVRKLGPVIRQLLGGGVSAQIVTQESPAVVTASRSEVEQLILNLVLNARDALAGDGQLRIDVELTELRNGAAARLGIAPGCYGRLRVTDDGPGMDDLTRMRCLEPFYTTKEAGLGSGLGLSTVYGVVRERRGHVGVDSAPGEGTSVTILVPAATRPSMSTGTAARLALRSGTKVLLAEEDDDLRAEAHAALTAAGADVSVAGSGEQALRVAAGSGGPDVLVTGAILPGLDGIELAARLRATNPDLPVLVVSGYAGGARHLTLGGDTDLLRKPYLLDELVERVVDLARPHG